MLGLTLQIVVCSLALSAIGVPAPQVATGSSLTPSAPTVQSTPSLSPLSSYSFSTAAGKYTASPAEVSSLLAPWPTYEPPTPPGETTVPEVMPFTPAGGVGTNTTPLYRPLSDFDFQSFVCPMHSRPIILSQLPRNAIDFDPLSGVYRARPFRIRPCQVLCLGIRGRRAQR